MAGSGTRAARHGRPAFWDILQAEVLDCQHFADPAMAEAAVVAYATCCDDQRLHGQVGWRTLPERSDDSSRR